ncbi:MAG: tRNA lysidine(34) synthetase TilS [Pseudomonadota bacterium]
MLKPQCNDVPRRKKPSLVALNHPFFTTCLPDATGFAVGVSGGADSMALLHLLSCWRESLGSQGPVIHALIVDHGLRAESATEAAQVATQIAAWPHVRPYVLTWTKPFKPAAKIQEAARLARHALLAQFCRDHDLDVLCLGHHADDQCETFLMRLAAGSGLDGLGGMHDVAPALDGDDIRILRPLLDATHADLVAYCHSHAVAWIEDPSNSNPAFARVRLRAAQDILAREGLSAERIGQTAKRLQRAREALDWAVAQWWEHHTHTTGNDIALDLNLLRTVPFDMQLRVTLRAVGLMVPDKPYPARLEALERLLPDLLARNTPGSLAYAGCLLHVRPKTGQLTVCREKNLSDHQSANVST